MSLAGGWLGDYLLTAFRNFHHFPVHPKLLETNTKRSENVRGPAEISEFMCPDLGPHVGLPKWYNEDL